MKTTAFQQQLARSARGTADDIISAIQQAEERGNLLPISEETIKIIRVAVISAQIAQAAAISHWKPEVLQQLADIDEKTGRNLSVEAALQ